MAYTYPEIETASETLRYRIEEAADITAKRTVLNSPELKGLYSQIPLLSADDRPKFGAEINRLKSELEAKVAEYESAIEQAAVTPLDVTAPFGMNVPPDSRPALLSSAVGSKHPLMTELETVLDIFYRMGFTAVESRQIDDDYHMFGALNFPEGHPARDDYDTFMTEDGLIAPAHTSTMQNRILRKYAVQLERGEPIAVVIPGRVFRNEDLDARHEHTFHQLEGIYVGKNIHAGNLIATLKTFLQEYYADVLGGRELDVKTQPFYFPFTEPSFEFALSCPFCDKAGCSICSYSGWIELLGCGMIHPNVLREAGIDPAVYTGFAWGSGIERLVMMKNGIEDVRYFESGKLEFLRQFS